jgi:hypothetical protein
LGITHEDCMMRLLMFFFYFCACAALFVNKAQLLRIQGLAVMTKHRFGMFG